MLTGVPTRDPELHVLRDMLMHKYGRDFSAAAMENRCGCVSERVSISPAGISNMSLRLYAATGNEEAHHRNTLGTAG